MGGNYSSLGPMRPAPFVERPLRVAIVPVPGFTLMPMACLVDFLRLASDESDYSRKIYCTWDVVSEDFHLISSSCGVPIQPDKIFADINPCDYDYLIVQGGVLHGHSALGESAYEFILAAHRAGISVAGSCSGSFILAEIGLLAGRRCAVHFALVAALRANFPDVIPITDEAVVIDRGIITSPGGFAAVSLARYIVANACGESRARKSLHYLLGERAVESETLAGDLDLGLNCVDRRVSNAIGLMRQKMYELCPIIDIAAAVGTTERELSRLFRKHLSIAPAQYWRQMRLKAAKWMVLNSDRSIAQVAYECGFADSAHFVHSFKRVYNETPAKLRKVQGNLGLR